MSYTIEEARSSAAEILAILREETSRRQALIQEISALQQGIVTQAAVDAIEQKNTQARARYRALLEPATKRFTTIANAGVGFFGRSELQQLNDTILAAFAVEDAATETARAALAQLKQSTGNTPGTDSAGDIQTEDQTGRAEGATSQNPPAPPETLNQNGTVVTTPGATTSSNAVQSGADPVANGVTVSAPSLPNNTSSGAGNVVTTQTSPVTNTSTPASPSNTNSLIGDFGTSSATQSYIYRAVKITHHFKAGKFTQQLNGSLVIYDTLPRNQTGSTQADDTAGEAEAQRAESQRQADSAAAAAAATNPQRVNTAQTPLINDTANPSSPSSETPPVNSEPLAPAETAPPTSGNEDISVTPAPPPSGPVSVVMGGATITAEISRSTDGFFFSIKLPSGENYSAGSVAGVVAGAQAKLQDPGDGDFNSLTLIVATFAQQQGPALEAQLIAQNTAPAVISVPSQNMAKEA